MGWIEFEALGFFCPSGADVFVGGKSFESLESSSEFVGVHDVGEVLPELLVGLVIEALDRCLFESSVHALDLAGARVFGFVRRWSMLALAQANSNAWARKSSPRWRASLISAAAEQLALEAADLMTSFTSVSRVFKTFSLFAFLSSLLLVSQDLYCY